MLPNSFIVVDSTDTMNYQKKKGFNLYQSQGTGKYINKCLTWQGVINTLTLGCQGGREITKSTRSYFPPHGGGGNAPLVEKKLGLSS